MRKEPRNVGLLVRIPSFETEDVFIHRFLGEREATLGRDEAPPVVYEKLPRWLVEPGQYGKLVADMRATFKKHGATSMNWVRKKYRGDHYQIVLGGSRFTDAVDVDEMWKELVL